MATNMANIGHTRNRSLRVPVSDSFLKRPAPVALSYSSAQTKDQQHNGPTHLTLFLRNLRLLSLHLAPDWPDITAETFSTKDNQQNIKKRIQSVEWALYHLFCLWDPRDAQDKLAPFFPPLEPLQSIKLRGALYTCLDHLKKNGILGRDAVLRKTMLDECKGERIEEVLSAFSTAVLKDQVQRDGGHEAVAQQLALEKFHYTAVPTEELGVLVLAHQVSLRRILDKKQEAKAHYNGFAGLLRTKDEQLAHRKEQLEKAIEEDESTDFVSRAETQALQDRVRKNWYGSNDWLESVIHGDGPAADGGLLSQPFDKVWQNVEAGDLEEVEGRRRKGLLEQLDARVQEQNSRLEKWTSFGEKMSARRKGEKKEATKEKKVPANLDLGLGEHETLQLRSVAKEKEEQKTWTPKEETASLLDRLRKDLANVGKPKRVQSPAKRRVPVYEEHVSRSPSPETVVLRSQTLLGNNTPRKQDWAPIGQNNTPRGQEWDFNPRDGRESVDLDGSRSPSPSPSPLQHKYVDEDVDMDMGPAEPVQQEEDEDSYEEITHQDAMDVDEPEPEPQLKFMAPPPPSSRLRSSPLPAQEIDEYASMAPPPAHSRLCNSPALSHVTNNIDYAFMAPPPASSKLRASPSPYAAQNITDSDSTPPPSIPRSLRRNTPSKTDLQARLRSSARKPLAKKPLPTAAPTSPDLATAILNSMDAASPSPLKRQQPLSRTTLQSASQPSFDPVAAKPRLGTPQVDSDDESLEQFTPRPAVSRGSSVTGGATPVTAFTDGATEAAMMTATSALTLAERTRMSMRSSMRSSGKAPSAEDEGLIATPRPLVQPTPVQPMTLLQRTQLSMARVRPKSMVKKSRQSIANLEEYEELQLVESPEPRGKGREKEMGMGMGNSKPNPRIRLSSVPFMDGMAEEEASEPAFGAIGAKDEAARQSSLADPRSDDLVERTRQSMKDLELVSQRAQMERKKSAKVAAKKKRESFLPMRQSGVGGEETREDMGALWERPEEVAYEDAFRSRPKVGMSPGLGPVGGEGREGSVSPFPG